MDIQAWWNALDALMRVLYAVAIPATCVLLIQIVLIAIGFGHAGGTDFGGADGGGMDAGNVDAGGAHHFGDVGDTHSDLNLHGADGAHLFGAHMGDADGASQQGLDAGHDAGHDAGGDAQHAAHEASVDALRLFTLSGIVSFFTVFGWSSIILYQNALPGALAVTSGLVLGYGAMVGAAKLVQWSVRLQEDGNLVLENAIGQTARVYIPIPAAGGGEGKVTLTLQDQFVELSAVAAEGEIIPSGTMVRVTGIRENVLTVERVSGDED